MYELNISRKHVHRLIKTGSKNKMGWPSSREDKNMCMKKTNFNEENRQNSQHRVFFFK